MKSIPYCSLLLPVLIITLFSCTKGYLDKNPTDQLSAGTFYSSKEAVDMALTACYGSLQNDGIYTTDLPFFDCLAGEAYGPYNENNFVSISEGPIVPTIGGYISAVYTQAYSCIARYNIFLQTLADYNQPDLDATLKNRYEAEARLLRAMKYFELYKNYGAVPLVTHPLTINEKYQPAVTADTVLNQINADIDFAVANLPNIPYAQGQGHLVKASAEVLKARVLLYDAYNADGSAKTDVMQQVVTVTADIMGTNYYHIAPSFRGLFCDDLGQQEGNPEFIFSVKYVGPNNNAIPYANWTSGLTYLVDPKAYGGAVNPTSDMANSFEFIDGSPFSTGNPLYDPANVYKNRDPRMAKTMFSTTVTFENGYVFTASPSLTGYSYYKHIEGSDVENAFVFNNGSDWPSMRYAEVLLMYAEAENEVDGATAQVYDAVNQIRNRADVDMPGLASGLSQIQMRQAIRNERRVELAFEGFRLDDLRRWQVAVQSLNIPASVAVIARTFLPKNYHWPIPQSEIDINAGILKQNPNY